MWRQRVNARRWWYRLESSPLLVDPAVQGSERGDGVPQCRWGLLALVASRWALGDDMRGASLEAAAMGTVHVGWRWGGCPLRHRAGRSHLPRQRRQSDMVQENSRASHDILPHGFPAIRYGMDPHTHFQSILVAAARRIQVFLSLSFCLCLYNTYFSRASQICI